MPLYNTRRIDMGIGAAIIVLIFLVLCALGIVRVQL
jgi:ABC-type sugar transport system permease subunit